MKSGQFLVSIKRKGVEKKHLAELIGDDYVKWEGKKILIDAPTGLGKTTFIVKVVLPYLRRCRKKMLILGNRKLLRMQYWYNLVNQFVSYDEIEDCVKIMTYQELGELIKRQMPLKGFFNQFEMIVCDECHFFYADADFNGFDTYVLLQEIIAAGATKTMIFMSATMEEVEPLIEETIKNCLWRLSTTGMNARISGKNREILKYDFSNSADYSRFHCVCVPDWETLCGVVAESPHKTVVFLNNKAKGVDMVEGLCKTGKVEKADIAVLNADNIESDSEVVQNLAIGNKLLPKILITTAVLDNGVSIHDPDVGNVVIETESKIEFLQMLGRIRAESVDNCTLYFVKRDKKEFDVRRRRYEAEVEAFKRLAGELKKNRNFYLQTMLNGDKTAEFYYKALVWMKFESQFYILPESEAIKLNRKEDLYINEFAKKKTGDMYLAESHFYSLALKDPLEVICAQMAWIGKTKEELEVKRSTYMEVHKEEFLQELLKVRNFSWDELNAFKERLVKEYRKDFFADILAKNGTISKEKLESICEQYGLELTTEEDSKKRTKIYSIKKKGEE